MQKSLSLGDFTVRVLITLLMIVLFLGLWELRDALMLIFLAVIVAIALHVPVRRLESWGLSRGASVLVTMAVLAVTVVLISVLIIPVFVKDISNLVNELPDAADEARAEYDQQSDRHDWLPDINWDDVTQGDVPDFVVEQAGNLPRTVFPFLTGIGGVITNLVVVIFVALFFIISPANYLESLLTMFPRSYRPRALVILLELGRTLQQWFIGQMISMAMLGTLIAVVMGGILGLPNPVALGVIAGLMEFIPNLGSLIGLLLVVVIALADKPEMVPWALLAYVITQQIQSNIIMPRIMHRQISMPAAMTLVAQVIAASLFGFMGLLLAVPLAVVVMVILREVYVFDILNAKSARIETYHHPDGASTYVVRRDDPHRPEQFSPGEAAALRAQGQDPFATGQIVEIITPPSPALEQTARSQQAVWMAILTLAVAQGVALIHTLLRRS
jgi:predicted PurR-regulated permease PerM